MAPDALDQFENKKTEGEQMKTTILSGMIKLVSEGKNLEYIRGIIFFLVCLLKQPLCSDRNQGVGFC